MKLGAHNSIAGGLHNAVTECQSIGGDAMQIFCKNQRQWTAKPLTGEEASVFRGAVAAARIGPNMVHDSYLINLGNPDPAKREASRKAFLDEYQRSEALGIQYLNFHPGSHLAPEKALRDDRKTRDAALDRIAEALGHTLGETRGFRCRLVLENAAGQGTNVGNSWEELGRILDAVGEKKRTGVTVDTQHSWACGYDWLKDYDGVWDAFDAAVGLGNLVAFHLNDSKAECGERVDRHDTVGGGRLGLGFFRNLVRDARFKDRVGYLETPEGPESWKKEIAQLRSLALT